jgi:hypothetical protein
VAPGQSQATQPATSPGFSFQPSYSGVYEAVPPDSPSSPCTTRTSADRRRYSSLAPVAQHPVPWGAGVAAAPGSRTILWACCKGSSFCLAARRSGLIAASPTRRVGNTLPSANAQPGPRGAGQHLRGLKRGKQVMGAGVESPRHSALGDVCKGRASPSVSAGASSARAGWGVRRRCLIYPGVGRPEGKIPAMLLVGWLVICEWPGAT